MPVCAPVDNMELRSYDVSLAVVPARSPKSKGKGKKKGGKKGKHNKHKTAKTQPGQQSHGGRQAALSARAPVAVPSVPETVAMSNGSPLSAPQQLTSLRLRYLRLQKLKRELSQARAHSLSPSSSGAPEQYDNNSIHRHNSPTAAGHGGIGAGKEPFHVIGQGPLTDPDALDMDNRCALPF